MLYGPSDLVVAVEDEACLPLLLVVVPGCDRIVAGVGIEVDEAFADAVKVLLLTCAEGGASAVAAANKAVAADASTAEEFG